jgi:hypothetical protein
MMDGMSGMGCGMGAMAPGMDTSCRASDFGGGSAHEISANQMMHAG